MPSAYTIRVFTILDFGRRLQGELVTDSLALAEKVFEALGPCYDIVQLWSPDHVYRQF